MDHSPPGSSVHGILQARTLEWVAMLSSRGSSLFRGLNLHLLCLLYWKVGSLPLAPLGISTCSNSATKCTRSTETVTTRQGFFCPWTVIPCGNVFLMLWSTDRCSMTVRGLEWLITETHRIKIMSCFRFGLTQLPPLVVPFNWIERVSFNPGQRFGKMMAGYCGWVDLTLRCLATQHGWLGWRMRGGGAPPVLKSDTLDFGSPLLWYLLCDIRHVT